MQIITEKINEKWEEYTLVNDNNMQVSFLNFGGIITKLLVPDQSGKIENVVLGYENYEDYMDNTNYFGAIIGRVSGRIANAQFTLNGQTYQVEKNEGEHNLHGGSTGFHQVLWDVETFQDDSVGAKLHYVSPNGEGGFPGNLQVTVTYRLTNNNQLIIDYSAKADDTTIVTLTNHSYFNLTGNLKETVKHHHVQLHANFFAELDEELIPTGKLLHVDDSPFDFRSSKPIERGIRANHPQTQLAGEGYDHYFIFNGEDRPQITVTEPKSGRILTMETNHPGIVMYSANGLVDNLNLREGRSQRYLGLCFETQEHPASLNHQAFPNVILKKGQIYDRQTIFTFKTV